MPLGQNDLPLTFGGPSNYRTEILTFEEVGFHRTYHAILGRPCYAKFMAIPNYTYLKLMMPSLHKVAAIGKDITEGAPDVKRATGSFEPVENVKEVLIDPDNSTNKMVRIGTVLSLKLEGALIDFLYVN
ncbi:uncharacterized protein [Miscanthus floridulus]|uniref:uncharacterized protein n=1 Tax=Miscanthus floridulus TaxID=154761 RepID=UPI00345A960F